MSLLGPLVLLLTLAGVRAGDCSCKEITALIENAIAPVKELCIILPSIREELSQLKGMLREAVKETGGQNSGTNSLDTTNKDLPISDSGLKGLNCIEVPGSLVQIDAGNGQVIGVNSNGNIYTLYGDSWTQLPGALKHATVGAAGIWGVNINNNIYKLVGGSWVLISGLLKQIDAGGSQHISGANMHDDIFCLGHSHTVAVKDSSSLPWKHLDGKLKYYSCGPNGCWGVNSADDIFFRHAVTPSSCEGSKWQHVAGKLCMIEVGSDGSVYGVNSGGDMYRRDGICETNLSGTSWTQLNHNSNKFRHVSYDLGFLWGITKEEKILKCQC